jgi:hypothetical protein
MISQSGEEMNIRVIDKDMAAQLVEIFSRVVAADSVSESAAEAVTEPAAEAATEDGDTAVRIVTAEEHYHVEADQVRVEVINMEGKTVHLHVRKEASVLQMKEAVARADSTRVGRQCLMGPTSEEELQNTCKVEECGLTDPCQIYLVVLSEETPGWAEIPYRNLTGEDFNSSEAQLEQRLNENIEEFGVDAIELVPTHFLLAHLSIDQELSMSDVSSTNPARRDLANQMKVHTCKAVEILERMPVDERTTEQQQQLMQLLAWICEKRPWIARVSQNMLAEEFGQAKKEQETLMALAMECGDMMMQAHAHKALGHIEYNRCELNQLWEQGETRRSVSDIGLAEFLKAYGIYLNCAGAEHIHTVRVLYEIGNLYWTSAYFNVNSDSEGDWAKAEEYLQRCITSCEVLFGPGHSYTQSKRENMRTIQRREY